MDLTNFIEAGKANFKRANEAKKALGDEKRQAELEVREARKQLLKTKRLAAQIKKSIRIREQERLQNQHGVSVGDYYRCKKRNRVACDLCKQIAAKYRKEQVAKDPTKFNRQKRESNKRNGTNHKNRDRARKRGVVSQYYTRKQIIDRDGLDCHICKVPVDLTANHVQGQPGWELYPHIDHVVPLALGGIDTIDNVKLAHAKCNIDKGTRLLPA